MIQLKHTLLALGLFTAFSAQAFSDNEARKAILELREQLKGTVQTVQEQQNRITQLNDDLSKLRGQYEQSQNLLNSVKSDQEAGYASIDKRLATLEPIPPEVQAQQSYDAAFALIQKGDYAAALKVFDKHARNFPNSAQATEVLYWQGTAAYGTRNYKTAITRLGSFLSKYPNHEKTPDALLTLGSAQMEGGEKAKGLVTLKQLTDLYPNSEAAKTAATLSPAKPK